MARTPATSRTGGATPAGSQVFFVQRFIDGHLAIVGSYDVDLIPSLPQLPDERRSERGRSAHLREIYPDQSDTATGSHGRMER